MNENTNQAPLKLPDDGRGGTPRASTGGPGASPSITAPANCIRPLRHGVDSLYVSFQGSLTPELAADLDLRKSYAKSYDDEINQLACIKVDDHFFTVLPSGRGRFRYVLQDNWYSIQLSTATKLPLALVQISSPLLTAIGPEEALRQLIPLIAKFGTLEDSPKINRIDMYADFTSSLDLTALPGDHWVKRCKTRAVYEDCNAVTGIAFGSGNEVSARIYDKTREITKSGKLYLQLLWADHGWKPGESVWRLEYQIRREGLPEEMKDDAFDALKHAGRQWRYLCEDWLRLTIPVPGDETRSRWPAQPIWIELTNVWNVDPDAPPLTRVPKTRPPGDDYLFRNGLAGITSFMAREGIEDFSHGLGEYLEALNAYFNKHVQKPNRALKPTNDDLKAYVRRKARAKARRYNVEMPGHEED